MARGLVTSVHVLPRAPRVRAAAVVAAAWVAAALVAALGGLPCPFASVLHRPCPGCGVTRAVALLLEGHVGASLRMHALAAPLLAMYGGLAVATVWTALDPGARGLVGNPALGRRAIQLAVALQGAAIALWAVRWMGLLGGPVAVGG